MYLFYIRNAFLYSTTCVNFFFIFAPKNVKKNRLFEFSKNREIMSDLKMKIFPHLRENL